MPLILKDQKVSLVISVIIYQHKRKQKYKSICKIEMPSIYACWVSTFTF